MQQKMSFLLMLTISTFPLLHASNQPKKRPVSIAYGNGISASKKMQKNNERQCFQAQEKEIQRLSEEINTRIAEIRARAASRDAKK